MRGCRHVWLWRRPGIMNRRDAIKLGGLALARAAAGRSPLAGQSDAHAGMSLSPPAPEGHADYSLRIAPVTVELDPAHILSTIGYNGSAPGPVLRMKEGKPVTVGVINDTDTPEFVHW